MYGLVSDSSQFINSYPAKYIWFGPEEIVDSLTHLHFTFAGFSPFKIFATTNYHICVNKCDSLLMKNPGSMMGFSFYL